MSEEPKSKSQYRRIAAQGGNALEMALSEIKALKAENEALKGRLKDSTNDGKFLEEKVVALSQPAQKQGEDRD